MTGRQSVALNISYIPEISALLLYGSEKPTATATLTIDTCSRATVPVSKVSNLQLSRVHEIFECSRIPMRVNNSIGIIVVKEAQLQGSGPHRNVFMVVLSA